MADYIRVPIVTNPEDVQAQIIDDLRTRIPEWVGAAGNLDQSMIEVISLRLAVLATTASSVLDTIYRTAGASLDGIPPNDATFAIASSTWTMRDTAGYLIPAGTEVKINVTGDEAVGFQVVGDITVPPGSSVTAPGEVQLVALVAGAAGSGLSGTVDLVTPIDGPSPPGGIALVGTTIGGRDAESDPDYLDRYTRTKRLFGPKCALPPDVATIARGVPGVGRVLVLDNYDPGPPLDTNAAAALTVIGIDPLGANLSGGVKTTLIATLAGYREQGFLFSVLDPVRTNVAVTFSFTTYAGFDPPSVKAAAEAAVTDYLSPAKWGLPSFGDQNAWIETTTVYFGELYAVLNAVPGLDHVTTLTITPPGTANTNATLTGPGALPNLTSVTGTPV